jgi:hypothetical protein
MISSDVFAVLERGAISLFCLPRLEESEPSLSSICKLALPSLRSRTRYTYCSFHNYCDERLSGSTRTPVGYQRLPFSSDWKQGIVYLLLSLSTETLRMPHYSLILSRKALSTIAEAELTANLSTRTDAVPWNEWGPRSSRLFADPVVHVPISCVGQRWILQDNLNYRMLVVRDFNVFRARRLHSKIVEGTAQVNGGSDAEYEQQTIQARVDPSTSMESNEFFVEDIVSELPFWETELGPYPDDLFEVVTDGEQLIGFVHMPVVSSLL